MTLNYISNVFSLNVNAYAKLWIF